MNASDTFRRGFNCAQSVLHHCAGRIVTDLL